MLMQKPLWLALFIKLFFSAQGLFGVADNRIAKRFCVKGYNGVKIRRAEAFFKAYH